VFLLPIFFLQKRIKLNTLSEDKLYLPLSLGFVLIWSWVFGWYFPVVFLLLGYGGFLLMKRFIDDGKVEWPGASWVTILSFVFIYMGYNHLPTKDYRPYAIGNSIAEGMKSAEELGLEPPKYGYIYTLINKETKAEKQVSDKVYIDEKWWENEAWEMDAEKTEQVKLQDGYEPPIHDFFLSDSDGNDKTQELLTYPKVYVMVSYDISKANGDCMPEMNALAESVKSKGIPFVAATSGSYNAVNDFRHNHQTVYDFWSGDAIMLKTIIRSNPGIMVLENGVVTGKYHFNDISEAKASL
jgi:hypothetical protein